LTHLLEFIPSGRFGHHQEPSLSAKIVALFRLLPTDDDCDQHGDGNHARQRERDGAFQLVDQVPSSHPGLLQASWRATCCNNAGWRY
jgi:hypothetical protein